jgi:hypothetical protein
MLTFRLGTDPPATSFALLVLAALAGFTTLIRADERFVDRVEWLAAVEAFSGDWVVAHN